MSGTCWLPRSKLPNQETTLQQARKNATQRTVTNSEGTYRSLYRLLIAATARSPSNVGNLGGVQV